MDIVHSHAIPSRSIGHIDTIESIPTSTHAVLCKLRIFSTI